MPFMSAALKAVAIQKRRRLKQYLNVTLFRLPTQIFYDDFRKASSSRSGRSADSNTIYDNAKRKLKTKTIMSCCKMFRSYNRDRRMMIGAALSATTCDINAVLCRCRWFAYSPPPAAATGSDGAMEMMTQQKLGGHDEDHPGKVE